MPPKRRATTSSTQSEAKRARILVTVSGGHAQPDRLIEYYKSGKLCDIELRVAGAAFKAHRLVMAACSDTLDRQFAGAGGFSDSASATVDLPAGYTAAALEATLDFIYSGECRVDGGHCAASQVGPRHGAGEDDVPRDPNDGAARLSSSENES